MPEWYRDSALSVLGVKKKDGKYIMTVADMNYMYSFSPADEPLHVILNWADLTSDGREPSIETVQARYKRGVQKLILPFISPQMWLDGPLSHRAAMRDDLVSELDARMGKAGGLTELMKYASDALVPGTIMDMYSVAAAAATGEKYERGRITTPRMAFMKQLTGSNIIQVDPVELFSKEFAVQDATFREVIEDFERVFAGKGRDTVTESQLDEAAEELIPRLNQASAENNATYVALKNIVGEAEADKVIFKRIKESGGGKQMFLRWDNVKKNKVNPPYPPERAASFLQKIQEADKRSGQVEEGKPETGLRYKTFNKHFGLGTNPEFYAPWQNPAETAIPLEEQ